MKKLKKIVLALIAMVMIAGCSTDKPDVVDPNVEVESKIVVATEIDLSTMDHHLATDATSFIAQTMVFAGLVELDENNQPQKDLAESWDVSDDGLVYTFHLTDTNWSNGTPVTAHDFVYGWNRLIAQETASQYSFIMETIKVKNAAAVTNGEMAKEELGIKALDDKTFEVTLDAPCDFLLGLMAFPSFFPMNEEFATQMGDQYALTVDNMLYCGPYVMSDWMSGSGYAFTKNQDYHNADAISTDVVEFKFIQDAQSAMLEYQSGNLDVVTLTGQMVDAYKEDDGFTNRLQGYLWYLSVNFDEPNLTNKDLRQAISYAIDREKMAELVLKDGSIAAQGLIPVALAKDKDGVDFRDSNGPQVAYDPAAALEYFNAAQSALGDEISVELLYEDTEAGKAVAEYIQNNLETNLPGMVVTLNSKPKKTRLDMMKTGDYQICLTRWGPDYADPQTYLDMFLSYNTSNNNGKYNSPAYDEAVLEATQGASASDSAARWELLKQAENIIIQQDLGVIPVYQNGGAMMIAPGITGIEFHSAGVDNYRNMVKE